MHTTPGILKTSCALILTALAGCASVEVDADSSRRAEFHRAADPALADMPFSEAVRAGDFLFLAGQIGNVPGTLELAEGGVGPETHQTIRNVEAILTRHGATFDDVVKATVFLADIDDWPAVNTVYREYFQPPFPARSAVAGSGLALGARVEIEVIAYLP